MGEVPSRVEKICHGFPSMNLGVCRRRPLGGLYACTATDSPRGRPLDQSALTRRLGLEDVLTAKALDKQHLT